MTTYSICCRRFSTLPNLLSFGISSRQTRPSDGSDLKRVSDGSCRESLKTRRCRGISSLNLVFFLELLIGIHNGVSFAFSSASIRILLAALVEVTLGNQCFPRFHFCLGPSNTELISFVPIVSGPSIENGCVFLSKQSNVPHFFVGLTRYTTFGFEFVLR